MFASRIFVACVALLAAPAVQPARTAVDLSSGLEFPPQDQQLWGLQRSGMLAKASRRLLAESPDDPAVIQLLLQQRELKVEDVLRTFRLIVDTRPARIPEAVEAVAPVVTRVRPGDPRRHRETLGEILTAARARLPELPREEAARADRLLTSVESQLNRERQDASARLLRFIEQYQGTQEARLAEVDVIAGGPASQQELDALDAFIAAHPGTIQAAKALYMKGFQLGFNAIGTIEPRGADPTDRFMRVVAIARELESGRYPQCEWVERAPSLVIQFFVPTNAPISADNVDRMLAAYQEFVISHFALAGSNIADSHLSFVIMTRMGDLHRRKGDEVGGIERVFAELERVAPDPAGMRYLRARYYMRRAAPNEPGRPDMLKKAREALTALANEGGGFYQRNSLATLAALEFAERDWSSARTAFRKYASAYPQSGWSWVASLRAAQCEEASGDPKRAAASFLEVSKKNDLSLARVLAHEYAARAHEAAGDFAAAVVPHQAAIDGWDDDFGPTYSTFVARQRPVDGPFGAPRYEGEVVKAQLPERIAQLTSSLTMPGGALLERGRWLIAAARYDEGIVALQQTVREYPGSPAAAEARRLTAHARLDRALDLADVEKPDADAAAATKELDALGREPFGFAVTAAKIARASMLWTSGAPAEGETLMMEALSEWHAHQRIVPPARGVEEDVAAIRRVVFLPKGGGVYGNLRWNAFSWPSTTLPPFVVVSQDVRVKRHDGSQSRVASVHDLPAAESKVLFFNAEQMAFFHKAMRTLGGTKRRQPGHIMETPNQPVGTSMNMLALWSKFFAARPGHWGGWEIETYPVVTEIEFANAERTKAAARVTVGYSGATIVLEKRSGRWIPVELTDRWVT